MDKNKKRILLVVLCLISLICITVGVTYAFFTYAKQGTTENTITTGTIEFLYTEVDKVGAGISISDAYPMSDEVGKAQTGSGKVFNFKVTSKVAGNYDIPYTVTARMKDDSTLDSSAVRVYLTEDTGSIEKELLLDNYSNLTDYENTPAGKTEKVIYEGLVPSGSTNYEKVFKLRMWVDEDTDFSSGDMNDKTFTLTVNVYANAKVVTDSDIDMANTTAISSILVNDKESSESDSEDYDYYGRVYSKVEEASINIETVNPEAEVEITAADGTVAYNSNGVKRLSTVQKVTVPLETGDNLYTVKVTSANVK